MPNIRTTTRVQDGLLKALDLTGVADGTELHGWNNWTVYRNGGSPTGLYEVRSGELRSVNTLAYALALWGHADVAAAGHVVRAQMTSTNWNSILPGLAANGVLDHSGDVRGLWWNGYELALRSGTGDYGEGFVATSGTTPGQPLAAGTWYDILLAAIQQPTQTHPRGGMAFGTSQLTLGESSSGIGGGVNDGSHTYPGLVYWNTGGAKWRNYKVYRDYRLTWQALTGSQAFRVFNAAGTVLFSSGAQSGGLAHVNIHTVLWPLVGSLQLFTDATYTTAVAGGRYPESGTANLVGGDVFELATNGFTVQVNWDDDQTWPNKWAAAGKDVSADVKEIHVVQQAANPDVRQDTLTLVLDDPAGDYVPAKADGSHYPNVRLNREVRVLATVSGVTVPVFYGRIAEYHPKARRDAAPRNCTIRAESPLRALGPTQAKLPSASGTLVDSSGTAGVIPTLLDALGDLVPAANRALDPTPDTTEDVSTLYSNVAQALQQLAIASGSLYGVHPQYRALTDEPDWLFFWQKGDVLVGGTADHDWNTESGDVDDADFRYTGDFV